MIDRAARDPKLIFFAELTYDTTVVSLEHFPIATGYIAGYAEKRFAGVFDYRLFKFAGPLLDAIDRDRPGILGLNHSCWNHNLSLLVAEHYRKVVPEGLVVFGGCSFPFEAEGQREFFLSHPDVDIFVPFDVEFGFAEVLGRYVPEGYDRGRILGGEAIDGAVFLDRAGGDLRAGKTIERPASLDEIPSPYLTGRLDAFFDDLRLTPMIQSTRGCPFPCAYCWAGNFYNRHVKHFSPERVAAELEYIAARRQGTGNRLLTFADSNFGMYEHDERAAEKIVELQKRCGFPSSFYSPCGKDNKDRVFRIIRQIVQQFKAINIPVETEIITGLPGETVKTHLQTIRDLIRGHAGKKSSLWKAASSRYFLPEMFRVGKFVNP